MSETAHDHELEVLEEDQTVPPRPEEQIADAREVGGVPHGSDADEHTSAE
jgi:hypothetical protein